MKVFIILINYCGEKDTIECIESIFSSHAAEYIKVVVVDNASPDGSGKRLASHYSNSENVTIMLEKENWGFSEGNNIGARVALECGASHVIFLNNDTIVQPQFLDKVIMYYDSHPEIGILTGKIYYYDNPDTFWYAGGEYISNKGKAVHIGAREKDVGQYDKVRDITFCCGCYIIMSAERYCKIGEMSNVYFLYTEDLDYSIQAMRAGFKLVYHPETAIYHKVSSSTGKTSPLLQYYMSRNSLLFVSRNEKGLRKCFLYLYQFYWNIKRAIKNHYNMKNVISGWYDFLRGRVGVKK